MAQFIEETKRCLIILQNGNYGLLNIQVSGPGFHTNGSWMKKKVWSKENLENLKFLGVFFVWISVKSIQTK